MPERRTIPSARWRTSFTGREKRSLANRSVAASRQSAGNFRRNLDGGFLLPHLRDRYAETDWSRSPQFEIVMALFWYSVWDGRAVEKRQRAAAVQNLAEMRSGLMCAKRLGVRQPSGALEMAQTNGDALWPNRCRSALPRCCARGRAHSGSRGKLPRRAKKTAAAKISLGWTIGAIGG